MTKTREKKPQSTIASWSATIVRALDGRGLDGQAIAARAGIDAAALGDPDARVPRAALTKLWELAVAESGDPAFGLSVPRYALQTTFHALGYAVLASDTLREALGRIIRYRRLIGDIIQLALEDCGETSLFTIDVSAGGGVVPPAAVDAFFAGTVRQARILSGGRDLRPVSVSLMRAAPHAAHSASEMTSAYERALGGPVSFSQPRNFIEISTADLDRRLPAANAELARQNEEVIVRYLARLEGGGVAAKTRQVLLGFLPSGAPGKEQVAKRLAMSPRTLARALAAEGTSFTDVLAQARLSLAESYLEEGRLPVTEIAFVLGFADTSAFSRAFKRWTGKAPSEHARRPRT